MAGAGVAVEAEERVKARLGSVHFSCYTARSGAAPFSLVEEHGLLDLGQGAEQFPHAHRQPRSRRLPGHQPGHHQRQHAVKDMDADLLSVQWNMGEKDTTLGSFIWRKSPSAASWER